MKNIAPTSVASEQAFSIAGSFVPNRRSRLSKVIKEKWGQYLAIDHFCTPLCSKRNGNIVIKKILEQKYAKSSVINLVPNA